MKQSGDPMSNLAAMLGRGGRAGRAPSASLAGGRRGPAPVVEVDDRDRVAELKRSHREAVIKAEEKRSLLQDVFKKQSELMELADDEDTTDLHDRLRQTYFSTSRGDDAGKISSKTKIKNLTNPAAANIIVELFPVMQVLKTRRDDELRQSAVPDAGLDQLLARFETLRLDVDKAVRKTKQDGNLGTSVNSLFKNPTSLELSLTYDSAKVPEDPAYRHCAVCNHPSMNNVSSQNWEQHNDTLNNQYELRDTAWKEYDKEKVKADESNSTAPPLPDDPVNPGQKLRKKPRKPRKSDYLTQTLMCMCATSQCNQEGTDNGSTCFVLCRNTDRDDSSRICLPVSSNAPRFQWTSGRCTCEICMCQCNKKYDINDHSRIGLLQLGHGAATNSESDPGQVRAFMSSMLGLGATAAAQADEDGADADDLFVENLATSAADAIGRIGPQSLSGSAMRELQRGLGRSTQVQLPGGQLFDTRRITANANAHGQNNRLPGIASTRPVAAPGMLDRLNPDYSNLSGPWQRSAAANGGSLLAEFARQGSALRREHNAPRQSYEQQMEQAVANSLEENTGKPEEDEELKQALINSKIDWNVYSAPPTSNGGTVDLVNSDNDGGGKMPSGGIVNLTHSDGSESSLGAPSRSGSSGASAPRRQGTTGGERIYNQLRSGTLKEMHPMVDKDKMTEKMKSERKSAKKRKKLIDKLEASPNRIGVDMATAIGVPGSDISRFADGAATGENGEECNMETLRVAFAAIYESDSD